METKNFQEQVFNESQFSILYNPILPAHTVVLKNNLALVTNAHFAADTNFKKLTRENYVN